MPTWHTDFRADLPKIDIPVLVLHGTEDRILPIEACGPRTHELISGSEYVPIEGACARLVLDARRRGQRRTAQVLQVTSLRRHDLPIAHAVSQMTGREKQPAVGHVRMEVR